MANMNSASRAYSFLRKASKTNHNGQALEAWAAIFKIEEPDAHKKALEVVRRLTLLSDELDDAYARISRTEMSPEAYESAFRMAYRAVSAINLSAPWTNTRNQLDAMTINALLWCADTLPDEGREIPEAERQAIWELLEELQGLVDDGEMPEEGRDFVRRLIAIMKRGLNDYEIQGATAFRRAVLDLVAEFVDGPPDLDKDSKASRVINNLLAKVAEAARFLDTLRKIADATGIKGYLESGT